MDWECQDFFFISSALIFLWIISAGMDAIIASARFFINKPFIREIVKEKIVEVEKPVAPVVRTEMKAQLKPQRQPVKRSDEPKTVLADVTQFRWDYVMESGFRALTAALALWLPGVHFPWGSLSEKCLFGCFYPCQSSAEGRLYFVKRTFRTAWGGRGINQMQVCGRLVRSQSCIPLSL